MDAIKLNFNLQPNKIQYIKKFDNVRLDVLREDLNHPTISGNKLRKLKYNLQEALRQKNDTIITFGGAFSNHILATAAAAKIAGIQSIGVIRGEELADKELNSTLKKAKDFGMNFKFISREKYRQKASQEFLNELKLAHSNAFILPEGGTNDLAIKGCEEILDQRTKIYDYICVCVGTGATVSGIINASYPHQKILAFPVLKNADFLLDVINNHTTKSNYEFVNAYHFGGYAKFSSELITFVNDFCAEHQIPLDPIYTGKMFFGIFDLIQSGFFPKNSNILAIHTGGLQGIKGFNQQHGNLIQA